MTRPMLFESDPQLVDRVCDSIIDRFASAPKAFEAEGCSKNTWSNYQREAQEEAENDEPGPYSEVVTRVRAALAKQAISVTHSFGDIVMKGSDADKIKAGIAILEKNHRDEYGKQQAVEIQTSESDIGKRALAGLYAAQDAIRAEEEAGEGGSE